MNIVFLVLQQQMMQELLPASGSGSMSVEAFYRHCG